MTPKKRTPRKKANETTASAGPSRKRKRVTKDAVAHDEEEEANAKEEEEDLPLDEKEPLAESAIKKEIGLDVIDPLLHPQVKDESPNADHGNDDSEWTEYKDEDADSDADQLSK